MEIRTNEKITSIRPDIGFQDKKRQAIYLIDVADQSDYNIQNNSK